MKIEYENAVVTIHFSQRPEEEVMENLKSATEKFLKNVINERSRYERL